MAKTSVNQGSNGQYKTTVPKDIGDVFNLDGKKLEWSRGSSKDKFEVKIVDE